VVITAKINNPATFHFITWPPVIHFSVRRISGAFIWSRNGQLSLDKTRVF